MTVTGIFRSIIAARFDGHLSLPYIESYCIASLVIYCRKSQNDTTIIKVSMAPFFLLVFLIFPSPSIKTEEASSESFEYQDTIPIMLILSQAYRQDILLIYALIYFLPGLPPHVWTYDKHLPVCPPCHTTRTTMKSA